MMKLSQKQVQHLLWRAGYAERYPGVKALIGADYKDVLSEIIKRSRLIDPLVIPNSDISQLPVMEMQAMSPAEKQAVRKKAQQGLKKLNYAWIQELTQSRAQLREKMAVFWHGHFACRSNNPHLMLSYTNTLRKHALSSFRDLLFDVSKEPAMLQFLNNQQNRKDAPNENFAREVMELFTLGQGQYSEADIKETARAFTGWGFNKEGQFVFRKKQHDQEVKTIFGKTGHYDGVDVLNMLLEKKETAHFLTEKIYRYLVNPQAERSRITHLADVFYQSDYNIEKLLTEIFTAKWFYDQENIGVLIKSPIDLLVGIQRTFSITTTQPSALYVQNVLGQRLLYPPDVSGWAGGKSWIDSSTIIVRTYLTEMLLKESVVKIQAKEASAEDDLLTDNQKSKVSAKTNMKLLARDLMNVSDLNDYLLQVSPKQKVALSETKTETGLLETIIAISKLPEYQLC